MSNVNNTGTKKVSIMK